MFEIEIYECYFITRHASMLIDLAVKTSGHLMDSYAGLFLEALHRSVDVVLTHEEPPLPLLALTMRLWDEPSYIANLQG
jgi:hypothetical protein